MSVPIMPYRFSTGQLDVENINDNLEAGARDINFNLSQRYTYSVTHFDLTGLTDADTQALRTFTARRFASGRAWEIDGIELVIYSTTGANWTLTATALDSFPSISLATAGATTEARVVSDSVVPVASHSSNTQLVLSADSASTITSGYLVIRCRADRGSQGDTFTGYTPTLLNAASSTAGSVLDTQLTALATAVTNDGAADKDLRVECFTVRGLTMGSTRTFRVPGGERRKAGRVAVCTAGVGASLTLTIDGVLNATVAGTGTSNTVVSVATLAGSAGTDPMDPADDTIIELGASGGTVSLGYALIFWS